MSILSGDVSSYNSFEQMVCLLERAEVQEVLGHTKVPVIGDRVCVGSNVLRARKDIVMMAARFALLREGMELRVFVDDFRADDADSSQAVPLGLTKGEGIDAQRVISADLHDAYLLNMNPDRQQLLALRGNEVRELTHIPDSTLQPAEAFAGGCVYGLLRILQDPFAARR